MCSHKSRYNIILEMFLNKKVLVTETYGGESCTKILGKCVEIYSTSRIRIENADNFVFCILTPTKKISFEIIDGKISPDSFSGNSKHDGIFIVI